MIGLIVYPHEDHFVMIRQHDHALASGEMARHWINPSFASEALKQEVILAVAEHDRGWIDLDHTPFWNDEKGVPFSFTDFPLVPKLVFYQKGIDEVEQKSDYAAILCSMHYQSFFRGYREAAGVRFFNREQKRQQRLKQKRNITTDRQELLLHYHFTLLQFCDDLSLYLCLQEPGTPKHREISWFKNGFSQIFEDVDRRTIIPEWIDDRTVRLTPFPLSEEIRIEIPCKRVAKVEAAAKGIAKAYHEAPGEMRRVRLTG